MNVLKLDDMWVSFNVREDLLENLTMGAEVQAIIPALENKEVTLKVFYIRDMGSYAVWPRNSWRAKLTVRLSVP